MNASRQVGTALPALFGERFLVHSDIPVPTSSSPEIADTGTSIIIAGDIYRYFGMSRLQRETLLTVFNESVPQGSPVLETLVVPVDKEFFVHRGADSWTFDIEFSHQPNEIWFCGAGFVARLEINPLLRGTLWSGMLNHHLFQGIIENYTRIVCAYALLTRRQGVLLHSSAVVKDSRSYLFYGGSGAGKSTIARKAHEEGWSILSDDLNALKKIRTGYGVCKTDFTGDFRGSDAPHRPWPINALLELTKGTCNELSPISPARCFYGTLAAAPFVNKDPHRAQALEQFLLQMIARIPAALLEVRRDTPFRRIDQLIREKLP